MIIDTLSTNDQDRIALIVPCIAGGNSPEAKRLLELSPRYLVLYVAAELAAELNIFVDDAMQRVVDVLRSNPTHRIERT